jgi:hypothetical protein
MVCWITGQRRFAVGSLASGRRDGYNAASADPRKFRRHPDSTGSAVATSMAALDGGRTSIDGAAVDDLSTTIRGDVLKPRDPGYSDHPTFNAMHARHPALIVRCVRLADRALWCSGQARREECAAQSDFVGGAVLLSLCYLLLRRILPLVLWRWRDAGPIHTQLDAHRCAVRFETWCFAWFERTPGGDISGWSARDDVAGVHDASP